MLEVGRREGPEFWPELLEELICTSRCEVLHGRGRCKGVFASSDLKGLDSGSWLAASRASFSKHLSPNQPTTVLSPVPCPFPEGSLP